MYGRHSYERDDTGRREATESGRSRLVPTDRERPPEAVA